MITSRAWLSRTCFTKIFFCLVGSEQGAGVAVAIALAVLVIVAVLIGVSVWLPLLPDLRRFQAYKPLAPSSKTMSTINIPTTTGLLPPGACGDGGAGRFLCRDVERLLLEGRTTGVVC